ncbi:hypothetical protein STEG23_017073 [Scotinomys teguina]
MARKAEEGEEEDKSRARQQNEKKPARHEEDKLWQLPVGSVWLDVSSFEVSFQVYAEDEINLPVLNYILDVF